MKIEHIDTVEVFGFLHRPETEPRGALALTHGAGGNCQSALLVAAAEAFANAGIAVLRYDLPFRRAGKTPNPSQAVKDREGIRQALARLRAETKAPLFAGGQSYGGRQTTMAAAEHPDLADVLLLLSYPLHPPKKGSELRTAHFPQLRTRAMFAHGSRDPFGSIEEMRSAIKLIPAKTKLVEFEKQGHSIGAGAAGRIVEEFVAWAL